MARHDLVIANARVAHSGGIELADVAVAGGTVVAVAAPGTLSGAAELVDGAGMLLLPGGVDPHVHFENPSWDTATAHDFGLGTEAAALGGTTTIIDFAFQNPGETPLEAIERRRALADPKVVVDYSLHGTVTDVSQRSVDGLPALMAAGCPSVKIFMTYSTSGWMVPDAELLKIMRHLHARGGTLLVHAENDGIVEACRHECVERGDMAAGAHARSRPKVAEVEAIRRVLTFAEETGCRTYIVHLSTGAGLEAIKEARGRGVDVHTETCPHYLMFDSSALETADGPRYVMSPPLRSADDREALWAGLSSGDIAALGSDDAAYIQEDKSRNVNDFREIPNGVPGVQVRTAVAHSAGVVAGRLTLERFVDAVAAKPAQLFGLWPRKGVIQPGSDADLALWDPRDVWRGDLESIHTNIGYTCYEDVEFTGRPRHVWSRGRWVVRDRALVAERGTGRYLERDPHGDPA